MPKPIDDISARVLEVFNVLHKYGKVKNQLQFCKAIGFDRSAFKNIEMGRRGFPAKHIPQLSIAYKINPLYIESGTGIMFDEPFSVIDTIRVLSFAIEAKKPNSASIIFTDHFGIAHTIKLTK